MDALLFCLGNLAILGLAIFGAVRLADRSSELYLGTIALFALFASLAVLAAGLAGHLGAPWVVWPLAGLAAVGAVKFIPKFRDRRILGFQTALDRPAKVAALALITFASFPVMRVFTAGTGYFIDDFGYHSIAVGSWIQHGDFRQVMPQFMAYLPLNAELLSGWFALPYRDDTMVVLAGLIWLALAAIAAIAITRRNGSGIPASLFTATLILAAAPVVWQTRTFSASDLAGAAALVAAIYFAVPHSGQSQRAGWAIVAGLLAGFSAGKAIFLPGAAAVCLFPLFTARPWPERCRSVLITSAAAAILGAFWYVRDFWITGNPLFPAEFGPFPGPLAKVDQTALRLVGLLALVPWTARLWGHFIFGYLDWPLPFGLLALAGYGRAILAEVRSRFAPPLENRDLRRLLLAAGTAQFLFHLIAPYCIGGGYVDGVIDVYCRYVMPWFLCGLILAAPLFELRSRLCWPFLALAALGLIMVWPRSGPMLYGGAAIVIASIAGLHFLSVRTWKIMGIAALALAWPILTLLAPTLRAASARNLSHFATSDGHVFGNVLPALDTLPAGTRITRFAHHPYLNSPIYGRRWQFDPVFTDKDGVPLLPLHLAFRAHPQLDFFNHDRTPTVNAPQLIANLRAAGITTVLVTKYDLPSWPPQQALLEQSGQATIQYQDETSTIWVLSKK